jgi:signal transduction histidine kinase
VFLGDSEMAARCRALDWAATALGPAETWPPSLRTAVGICLASGFPTLVMWGPELVQVYNDAFRAVLQAKHPAALGQRARDCWPELWAAIGPMYQGVLDTGRPVFLEDQLFTPARRGGEATEEAYFTFSYSAIPDEWGRPAGVLATVFETTRHMRARSASDAARDQAEAVLGSIADAFYLLDRDWRFTYVNAAAEPLLQTTADALVGRTLWEAFPDVAGSVFEGPYREAMATGRPTSAEAYFAPLGTWFDVRSYPWPGGLMVHFRDVGARKAAEAERERLLAATQAARADAEAASRAKSEFLAVMSHELRTPLNAIGGYAELIELGIRGPVTAEQREDLARIQRAQRHLLGLINGVLNYARVEAGAVHYAVEDVALDEVLATCETLTAPQVRAKGLTLRHVPCARGADGRPLRARADGEKVRQIVLNLLSNAVKFTAPGGELTLQCGRAGDEPEHESEPGRVRVWVRDTGRGIAPHQLARIFEPFVQLDAALTRTQDGTGLGLAISRDLARGMGGDLTAESTPGVGSTFTVTLPTAASTAA